MLRFMALMAVVASLIMTTPDAHARKMGGGKSFGKSFKTAPIQKNQSAANGAAQPQKAAAGSSKKGLMGGILGGLLAGGLLAAFFGGAFEGIQFMDILLIGLLAFIGFKIFRSMTRAKADAQKQPPAYAGGVPGYQPQQPEAEQQPSTPMGGGTAANASDVPHNLPNNFDMDAFLKESLNHYRTLQEAWNVSDFSKIQEYISPEIYNDLVADRNALEGDQHTEVQYLDAEIVRADYNRERAQISLKFTGRYNDNVEGVEEDINDIWHLERDLVMTGSPWVIVGME